MFIAIVKININAMKFDEITVTFQPSKRSPPTFPEILMAQVKNANGRLFARSETKLGEKTHLSSSGGAAPAGQAAARAVVAHAVARALVGAGEEAARRAGEARPGPVRFCGNKRLPLVSGARRPRSERPRLRPVLSGGVASKL